MNLPKYLGMAIIAAAILLLSVSIFRRYLPYVGESLGPKQPPSVMLSMEDAYLVGMNNRGKTWSVRARSVEVAKNRSSATISGIYDGRIFDKDYPELRIKATRAVYDSMSRHLMLFGGVRIDGREGQSVTADGADWDSISSILKSRGGVRLQTKGSDIRTQSLAVNLKKKELEMKKAVIRVDVNEVGADVE